MTEGTNAEPTIREERVSEQEGIEAASTRLFDAGWVPVHYRADPDRGDWVVSCRRSRPSDYAQIFTVTSHEATR